MERKNEQLSAGVGILRRVLDDLGSGELGQNLRLECSGLGGQIHRLRITRGVTQAVLAAEMTEHGFPWHQTTVYRVENDKQPVEVREIQALAKIFDVPAVSFLPPEREAS